MELEARENQLRNVDFKYKKFYQKKTMGEIREMKDYLKEVKDQIAHHYDHMAS